MIFFVSLRVFLCVLCGQYLFYHKVTRRISQRRTKEFRMIKIKKAKDIVFCF